MCASSANFMRRVITLSGTIEIDASCFEMEFQLPANATRRFARHSAGKSRRERRSAQVERQHLEKHAGAD